MAFGLYRAPTIKRSGCGHWLPYHPLVRMPANPHPLCHHRRRICCLDAGGLFAASPQEDTAARLSIDEGLNKIARYVSAEHLRDRFYPPALLQAKLQEDRQLYSTALQRRTVFQQ